MREQITVQKKKDVILQADEIIYAQRPYWCGGTYRQLSLSLLKPRTHYVYDSQKRNPAIVFLCGGGFQKMDRNAWIPELAFYAENGYVIASVDYSVLPESKFPDALEDVKEAIRFLRSHAETFSIDPDRIAIMGESAGGTLAVLAGVTSGTDRYDTGDYIDLSSAVQAVVAFYPATHPNALAGRPESASIRVDLSEYPDTSCMVNETCPPMYFLHGTEDIAVPYDQSIRLYESLNDHHIPCRLTLVEGAGHADALFYQTEMKEKVLNFLNGILNTDERE